MEKIDRRATNEDGTERTMIEWGDRMMDKLDEIVEWINEQEQKKDGTT